MKSRAATLAYGIHTTLSWTPLLRSMAFPIKSFRITHVVETVHYDGAERAASRLVKSEGQENGRRHREEYKLPPGHVINVSKHQWKMPIGPEKPKDESSRQRTESSLQSRESISAPAGLFAKWSSQQIGSKKRQYLHQL